MHIPDGYISPQSAGILYILDIPFFLKASKLAKKILNRKSLPLVSIFSSFCFLVMMFNIPLPGGTTGHAVGATVVSIVLGPWVATLVISVALIIQAIFFGDGGILALGTNIFTMAIAMSFVSSFIYTHFGGESKNKQKKIVAASLAGYVSLNVAALLTAIILGIQPYFFADSSGHALYFPYNLTIAIPAMMAGHLTIVGIAEAFVSGFVVSWILRVQPELLEKEIKIQKGKSRFKRIAWICLFLLVITSPIGILASGTAWGEWSREELKQLGLTFIPAGFDRWFEVWHAPIPHYVLPIVSNPKVSYIIAALLGVGIIIIAIFLLIFIINIFTFKFINIKNFLEKTIHGISSTLEQSIFAEQFSKQKGILQELDPRTKIFCTLLFLICISLTKRIDFLFILHIFIVSLAYFSRIPLLLFIKRVWLLLPFFTGIIVLPIIFNVITPGLTLFTLVSLPKYGIVLNVTLPGVIIATTLLLRVSTSVATVFLLIFTTEWMQLLQSLHILGIPVSFIMILSTTHRYIYFFLRILNNMLLARKSRSVGKMTAHENRLWIASVIGVLIGKSYILSDEVYLSMLSRGFNGTMKKFNAFSFKINDYISWIIICILFFLFLFTMR